MENMDQSSKSKIYELECKVLMLEEKCRLYQNNTDFVFEDYIIETYIDSKVKEELQKELLLQKERFDLVMNATNDGVWDMNLLTDKIYFSPSWKQMLGYEDEELENDFRIWEKLLDPSDMKKFLSILVKLIGKSLDVYDTTYRMKHKDGHWIDIRCRGKVFQNEEGRVYRFVGTHTDITKQKTIERKLKDSTQLYYSFFNNNKSVMLLVDPERKIIVDANKAAIDFYGYPYKYIKNMPIDTINIIDKKILHDDIDKTLLNKHHHFKFKHRLSSGIIKDVEVFCTVITMEEKELIFSIIHDITAQVVAEKKLVKSERELKKLNATKDKFFSIISHDLKNPFTVINGYLSLLIHKWDDYSDDTKFKYIESISNSSQKTFRLLTNLLDWSRAQMNKINYSPSNIVFQKSIDEVMSQIEDLAKNKEITITYSNSEHIVLYSDKDILETVLRNLLSNAIKFTPKNGLIEIVTSSKKEDVLISVKDNGLGMSEETKNKIFSLEAKISTMGTDNETGTGLGLQICEEFVKINRGTIFVESTLGEGSTFSFTVPSKRF